MSKKSKAVVLVSGGLDSAVMLAKASEKFDVLALTVDYGQKCRAELSCAHGLAEKYSRQYFTMTLNLRNSVRSGLLDGSIKRDHFFKEDIKHGDMPDYFPARNAVLLSLALSVAETHEAYWILSGLYPGTAPDSTAQFVSSFAAMAQKGTLAGQNGKIFKIRTFGKGKKKSDIIRLGDMLGVPFKDTISCFDPVGSVHCGICEACMLRRKGFQEAGIEDPTLYYD